MDHLVLTFKYAQKINHKTSTKLYTDIKLGKHSHR